MKYIPQGYCQLPVVELTERNLRALLAKLDNPQSYRTLIDPDRNIAVRAVPDEAHYTDREPGPAAES